MYETRKKEKALLVVVREPKERWSHQDLAAEFKNLAFSAGSEVAEIISVNLQRPNPSLYIGKGKAEEIKIIRDEAGANVVILDNDLKFTQQRNLEDIFGVKTIDRTQLILDIFARHAHTQEGSLQVELAQLEYLLPRLKGKGIMLSRLGGGIGTRGPGEKKLEVDRRRIAERITRLKKELLKIREHRNVMRKKRKKENIPMCSLVGYTNAGKTTLFNALAADSQTTSSALFTTLDTVSRTLTLQGNFKVILSDTVGFIYKLPPHLIEAFKATLEELQFADIMIHLIDSSNKNILQIKKSVDSTLKELGLENKPTLTVFNKIDTLSVPQIEDLRKDYPQALFISAAKSTGLWELGEEIYGSIFKDTVEAVVKLPFSRMELSHYLHQNCEILKTIHKEQETVYWVKANKDKLAYLQHQGLSVKEI